MHIYMYRELLSNLSSEKSQDVSQCPNWICGYTYISFNLIHINTYIHIHITYIYTHVFLYHERP